MWHNLAGHLERSVLAHRGCLRELPHPDQPAAAAAQQDTTAEDTEDAVAPVRELRIVTRTRERYQAITALHADGASIAAIARTLGLDRHTVRRFVRAASLEQLQAKTLQRASLLDGYTDYLHQRWAQGCTDAAALTKEITALI
jgi:DNA-binding NarL/FixJ family response regulator